MEPGTPAAQAQKLTAVPEQETPEAQELGTSAAEGVKTDAAQENWSNPQLRLGGSLQPRIKGLLQVKLMTEAAATAVRISWPG